MLAHHRANTQLTQLCVGPAVFLLTTDQLLETGLEFCPEVSPLRSLYDRARLCPQRPHGIETCSLTVVAPQKNYVRVYMQTGCLGLLPAETLQCLKMGAPHYGKPSGRTQRAKPLAKREADTSMLLY